MRRAELRQTVSGAAAPAAGDVSLALVLSAVVVERRKTGERCGFFAADPAELGHADDEGEGGALAQAGNAQHQIETMGEIVMGAQRCDDARSSVARRVFSRAMSP